MNQHFLAALRQAPEQKLLATIAFHFAPERLRCLAELVRSLSNFMVGRCDIVIVTNTSDHNEVVQILAACKPMLNDGGFFFHVVINIDHPYSLVWGHVKVIDHRFLAPGADYTHFIYLEDDMAFSFENFIYFLAYRPILAPYGLLPSFLRLEFSAALNTWTNPDRTEPTELATLPQIGVAGENFINPINPYTAFFIMDRELILEYRASRSSDMNESLDVSHWTIRERAAMGLSFENVPPGFESRYVVPISATRQVPSYCLVRHLPNNYTDNRPDWVPLFKAYV